MLMNDGAEHVLVVGGEEAGTRLDLFLSSRFPDLSRSQVQRAIKLDLVSIDGVTAWKSGIILREGQEVVFRPAPRVPLQAEPEDLPLDVLFEDEHIIVVNKSAGMVVHPAAGHPSGTLVNALLARYPGLTRLGPLRPGLVHRLDRGTSGAMVVAKTPQARESLADQFLRHAVFKGYLAVLMGSPPSLDETARRGQHIGAPVSRPLFAEGRVDRPIDRHPTHRKRFSSMTGSGRPSSTLWRVLDSHAGFSLATIRTLTGRTHQIRVHMADEGFPVAGDDLYCPGWRSRVQDKSLIPLMSEGPLLHAWLLSFSHPSTGTLLTFVAPLRPGFRRVLKLLFPTSVPARQETEGVLDKQLPGGWASDHGPKSNALLANLMSLFPGGTP